MMAYVNSHERNRMPTPDRTSLADIVAAARALLDDGGPSAVTMQAVASRVGVRAPSLYKRVRDRDALLEQVARAAADELAARLAASDGSFGEIAPALRAFAKEQPHAYRLLFSGVVPGPLDQLVEPVLAAARNLAGERHALDAARLMTAWVTGFIGMELAGAFQLGGDVDAAFGYGMERIRASLSPVVE
jgi:AcrR family transcriptional regulator